ncbi:Serine/threonine-protein kinase BUR1 [Tetrabaena socialis]|uniref:Serine/threonine-protein kinase BUR1 n=1 Tax=Tetrabaena socialis TaxID=47790 RepID=A0A2J8AJU2_9CHLO|nr:Serine/threonine-protein kinase BUR1 [Tetrabaena socialis]|eukprot:PNH12770.1 Serine/threonine-protein kinase BUR1 [Tetrabaena socialis]
MAGVPVASRSSKIQRSQEPGVYYVEGMTWQVALKRVGDVFASTEYGKRVLREVCIMRRIRHPNVIELKDVFIKPSPTGKWVFRNGRLVPTSFDCYLAMEYCGGGDLFSMRGQLPEHEVRSLTWQLLSALRYLHGLNVWHRDIKTGNLLLTLQEGRRVLKVADFGSARSAVDASLATGGPRRPGEEEPPEDEGGPDGAPPDGRPSDMIQGDDDDSYDRAAAAPGGLGADTGPGADGRGVCRGRGAAGNGLVAVPAAEGGFMPPLTSLVCTPCYRAPEVVMSRGGYSSAMDMWSAGCVFGELLHRAAYVGKATTPHLQAGVRAGAGGGGSARGVVRRNNSDGMLGPEPEGYGVTTGHLRPDPGQQLDSSVIAELRVPFHADATTARLEPELHLSAGRHGEWTESSLPSAASARRQEGVGTWGVTVLPPGFEEGAGRGSAARSISRQHAR